MQFPPSNKSSLHPRWTLSALGLVLISLVLVIHQLAPTSFTTPISDIQGSAANLKDHAKNLKDAAHESLSESPFRDTAAIPNIVHFVHLVPSGPDPVFNFPFHQFVAIYSAYYYLQPETIYIHTNVHQHLIEQAVKNTSTAYTKAVSKLPTVKFNYHSVHNVTSKGIPVENLPHQSDFVRTDVLKKYGGIYLDDDAYILRDIHPLRRMGFENLIGRQLGGDICNAVIMSTRNNKMMTAYRALQDEVFDGSWERHSVKLLSSLAMEFNAQVHQLLVLPQDAFFPLSWYENDLQTIYHVQHEVGESELHNADVNNITTFIENFNMWGPDTWRRDWRSSYVLHGWTSAIGQNLGSEEQIADTFGKFGGITLEYVLERNSNFARAVYPAVKNALDMGVLDHLKYDQSHSET